MGRDGKISFWDGSGLQTIMTKANPDLIDTLSAYFDPSSFLTQFSNSNQTEVYT